MNPARQFAALRQLASSDMKESQLRGRGRCSHNDLMVLLQKRLATITTINNPDSFDNAFYDHTYRITDRGRVYLSEQLAAQPQGELL